MIARMMIALVCIAAFGMVVIAQQSGPKQANTPQLEVPKDAQPKSVPLTQPADELPIAPPEINPDLKAIQNALEGKQVDKTRDEFLDEALRIIKQRGSVLDGSVMNEIAGQSGTAADQKDDEVYQAAELALRAARLLSQSAASSNRPNARQSQINDLRRVASELLGNSPIPTRSEPPTLLPSLQLDGESLSPPELTPPSLEGTIQPVRP